MAPPLTDESILLRHGFVAIPGAGREPIGKDWVATLATNLTHYGFALSAPAFEAMRALAAADAERWWGALEPALAELTGADRPMAEHVVYKNFPAEVLAMDELDYWIRQSLMYWGLPNDLFTEPEAPRPALDEPVELRTLKLAGEDTLGRIFGSLVLATVRWSDDEWDQVRSLAARLARVVPPSEAPFKENLVRYAALCVDEGLAFDVESATDVLRLAVAMSGHEPDLRTPVKLRTFQRRERRFLLAALENAGELESDVWRRPERFKRLLRALRPGDWAARYPRVVAAYHRLYRGDRPDTFASQVETLLAAKDPAVLECLATRPGVFARRLHHCLRLFGGDAAGAFVRVIPKLSTARLLTLARFLETVNERRWRLFPPGGRWRKVQKREMPAEHCLPEALLKPLVQALRGTVRDRVAREVCPVHLDPATDRVCLPDSDTRLAPYGRGTRFSIPEGITFVRTSSYWRAGPSRRNVWFDNGWNFFDASWKPMATCCWDTDTVGPGAVFSGDPTSSKDPEGRGTQLIDLALDELRGDGVRYGLWSVLGYSRLTFDEVPEVFATLQWGADSMAAELIEPARCQLAFPLRGSVLAKHVAYLDLESRELVFMDLSLPSSVMSAQRNAKWLGELMPAVAEELASRPTVHDLFRGLPADDERGVPIAYTDAEAPVEAERAWVFRPVHEQSAFEPIDVNALLGAKATGG